MAPSQAPIHRFSLRVLLIVPVLLAIATIVALFVHSDVNAAMLWSQCHSHAALPSLSRLPVLGTPLCYLVSFFHVALDALRSKAVMAVVLAFIGGLLTVSTVEAARVCNAPHVVVAYPTGPWLVLNLIGGAVVWELVITPALLHSTQALFAARKRHHDSGDDHDSDSLENRSSHLPDNEVIAIPISVAIGYFLPSILMLVFNSPVTIGIWLFFPIYVSLIRQGVRKMVTDVKKVDPTLIHLESDRGSLAFVYALPVLLSMAAHVFIIWNLTQPDDRKKMTKSTLTFIEIDIQFIFWTVLYWMLVEVGWRVPLITIASALSFGPGGGTCLGWVYREKLIHNDHDSHGGDEEPEQGRDGQVGRPAHEETPLLQ
ncbi:hypothetical protein B0J13DRAFT_554407 [Dactylonectria estremocensis]|uniref:Uncharacterized protein n=1 Tax=Dactylonectria estremocensis TaxID=1079267 RepID=A0A9P9EV87_9HYPO|nr:hypothetical protein B0J13DRAFT_554407 [Dactylonectria estremocensis]